jgi:hypothetical protein
MHALEAYARALHETRSSGAAVEETSYYGALERLFNEVGKSLKPRVRCVINLKSKGAGIPDVGFFTTDQFQRRRGGDAGGGELLEGQIPARGVVEVKGTGENLKATAKSQQVAKYLKRYGQVLLTNYREFMLLGNSGDGKPIVLEPFSLAPDERAFWRAVEDPLKLAEEQGERFADYLKRVMLRGAPLTEPEDVAWFLASYAREARFRIERSKVRALAAVRQGLEQALGITFEGERGDHFFRSTLVQTLFYGIFSAWVLWHKQRPQGSGNDRFNWREAAWSLRVPMVRALFEQVATPTKLGQLDLVEVLDWTEEVLSHVDRSSFFTKFEEARAIQYFYEPFLEAFDPDLRKELGVWYTPPEVVQYMVARVDTVLREELGLADGFADPNVYVLDPCCGTGTFLVETLRRIAATLKGKGDDALMAQDLKRAAQERLYGFEILPAPLVVAHLQLGLLLQQLGAPLADEGSKRIGVFLTNALNGWEPPQGPKQHLLWPELEEERDAAGRVKRDVPVIVIMGNPPYNGFAGVAMEEERDLSEAYRTTQRAAAPQGQGLNDLYVRFYRMAERKIVERTGRGVVCYISNYSWLDGLSFTGMRERYLEEFDRVWIDCLNGDKYKTGKLTPEGEPDPSIFSTEMNREGIQVGTAIALLVRKEMHAAASSLQFRHLWGTTKRTQLLESMDQQSKGLYRSVTPDLGLGLPFMPAQVATGYLSWPQLPSLFPTFYPGVKTSRDDLVVDVDRHRLEERMRRYFDPQVSNDELSRLAPSAMESTATFDANAVRSTLVQRGFLPDKIVKYAYRPLDVRWLYWEPATELLDRKREDYMAQVVEGNTWFSAGQRNRKEDYYQPQFTTHLADHHLVESNVGMFPRYVRGSDLFTGGGDREPRPNLTPAALSYIAAAGAGEGDVFDHALAVLHAPTYRLENAGALRQDWPRVPMPSARGALVASAAFGRRLAAVLDAESPVTGVTTGRIEPQFKVIGRVTREGRGTLDPDAGELALTAGWGHAGKGGATMPGRGKLVVREYTDDEKAAVGEAAVHLGDRTCDVYLNDVAYWKNVPIRVWEYTLGGYQVIKKWLSYREQDLMGRSLTVEEARYVQEIARRIAAILLLGPELDANYAAVKRDTFAWPA